MDPAVIGRMRIGYFRIGVTVPIWDQILDSFKKTCTPQRMAGFTPCIQGYAKQGLTRQAVKIPLFDQIIQEFKKVT